MATATDPSTIKPTAITSTPSSAGDLYTQALGLLQPSVKAQTAPLEASQANLPTLYGEKKQALTDQSSGIQNLATAQQTANTNQEKIGAEGIRATGVYDTGAQRASAAAAGFASPSGTEKSAESNIANRTALRLQQLDTSTIDQNTIIGLDSSNKITQISDAIAALPTQEAQDSLNLGIQIAHIQGQGAASALTYATTVAQMQADMAYKSAELAISEGNLALAKEKADEAARHDQASESISRIQAQTQANPPSYTETTKEGNPLRNLPFGIGNLFPSTKQTTKSYTANDPLSLFGSGSSGGNSNPLGLSLDLSTGGAR